MNNPPGVSQIDNRARLADNGTYISPTDSDTVTTFLRGIGDFVWDDLDADGIQDAGETGHASVSVTLRGDGADNTFGTGDDTTQSTTTNASGYYFFANPATDTYRLEFAKPANYS